MKKQFYSNWISLVIALALLTGGNALAGGLVDLEFEDATFPDQPDISNSYWPIIPGDVFLYFAETEDGCEWNIVQVTYDTINIEGAESIVVLDLEFLDETEGCDKSDYSLAGFNPLHPRNPSNFPGDLAEATFDWYAQDDGPEGGGNIWYLGEDTLSFDWDECDGTPVPTDFGPGCPDGSFIAGPKPES